MVESNNAEERDARIDDLTARLQRESAIVKRIAARLVELMAWPAACVTSAVSLRPRTPRPHRDPVTIRIRLSPSQHGFQSWHPDHHREIARMGGLARAAKRVGHFWTAVDGKIAGRKGGLASAAKRQDQRHALK